jgi:hypothetical protein
MELYQVQWVEMVFWCLLELAGFLQGFMKLIGLSHNRLAKEIDVPPVRRHPIENCWDTLLSTHALRRPARSPLPCHNL